MITVGSNRDQRNPTTPDTVTDTNTLIRRNQFSTTVTPLRYNRTSATETAYPTQRIPNIGEHNNGRGFGGRVGGPGTPGTMVTKGNIRNQEINEVICSAIDQYKSNVLQPPIQAMDTPPTLENVNIQPTVTMHFKQAMETRIEEDEVYYPTIPPEIVQSFTPTQTEILYENLHHIYDNTSGGTIMAQNVTKEQADNKYSVLQNYGQNFLDCCGWQMIHHEIQSYLIPSL
jgi:hypothetical protein